MPRQKLSVERVQAALEETRAKLAAAQRDLPVAQRNAALAALGGPRCLTSPADVRVRIATLADLAAGLEALLPVAERLELLEAIAALESAAADRARRSRKLADRLSVLQAELDRLPPGAVDPVPFRGEMPSKHPTAVEFERVRAERRTLDETGGYADLRLREAQRRVAAIEAEHPHVLDEAQSAAA